MRRGQPSSRGRKRKLKEIEPAASEEEEIEKSDGEESSDGSGDGSSSDEIEFEPLATTRSRRATAGTKMKQLIEEQKEKDAKEMVQSEEVYKDFFEVENDEDFQADNEVIKSESEVDSDFDEEEGDDGPEDAGEQELKNEHRNHGSSNADKARRKRERMMKELATSLLVEDNVVDDKTHARYMKEAKLVAKKNLEDLRRIDEELEKQRNETLESLRPRERIERTDVIRTKEYFDENDDRIRQIFIPNDALHLWNIPQEPQQPLSSIPEPMEVDETLLPTETV